MARKTDQQTAFKQANKTCHAETSSPSEFGACMSSVMTSMLHRGGTGTTYTGRGKRKGKSKRKR